jgi:hypothetical protein
MGLLTQIVVHWVCIGSKAEVRRPCPSKGSENGQAGRHTFYRTGQSDHFRVVTPIWHTDAPPAFMGRMRGSRSAARLSALAAIAALPLAQPPRLLLADDLARIRHLSDCQSMSMA